MTPGMRTVVAGAGDARGGGPRRLGNANMDHRYAVTNDSLFETTELLTETDPTDTQQLPL
jgi:hypothetical protein